MAVAAGFLDGIESLIAAHDEIVPIGSRALDLGQAEAGGNLRPDGAMDDFQTFDGSAQALCDLGGGFY